MPKAPLDGVSASEDSFRSTWWSGGWKRGREIDMDIEFDKGFCIQCKMTVPGMRRNDFGDSVGLYMTYILNPAEGSAPESTKHVYNQE